MIVDRQLTAFPQEAAVRNFGSEEVRCSVSINRSASSAYPQSVRKRPHIDVKNKFSIGDELELILPEGNRIFRLENMLDMDGNPIKEAPDGGYRVQILLDGQDCAMGLLARYL